MALGKKSTHSDHPVHPDEKWLVSYSDMMTLLFGFFVLMYALAAENPKGANALAEIADSLSGKVQTQKPKIVPISETELKELKAQLENLQKMLNEKENHVLKLQQEIQTDSQTKVELTALQTTLEKKHLEVEMLKNELATNKPDDTQDSVKEKVMALENQVSLGKTELTRMRELLEEMKSRNFLMVFTKWDTEKHDLDLTVKSPTGAVYNFKNRKISGRPGELILDSRYGPGAEIWTSNKLVAGTYEAQITLYNQYGNTADALVETTLVTGLGNVKLPVAKLNKSGIQNIAYKFKVNDDGRISLINSK